LAKAMDVAYKENLYIIESFAPLIKALKLMGERGGIYRLSVVDDQKRAKGVISSLRILEYIAGHKGKILKKKAGGLEALLQEPVLLFMEEYLHKLPYSFAFECIVQYMVENKVGHVILVDEKDCIKGVITERPAIERIPPRHYGINLSAIMTRKVHTIKPESSIFEALNLMAAHHVRRLPLLSEGEVVGVLSASDLFRYLVKTEGPEEALKEKENLENRLSEEVVTLSLPKPVLIGEHEDVGELLKRVQERWIPYHPVVSEEGKLAGVVSERDLITRFSRVLGMERFLKLIA